MRTSEPPGWNRVTKWHAGSASMRMRHQHECESSRLTASSALGSGGMRLGIDAGFLDSHACCAVPGCSCMDSDLGPTARGWGLGANREFRSRPAALARRLRSRPSQSLGIRNGATRYQLPWLGNVGAAIGPCHQTDATADSRPQDSEVFQGKRVCETDQLGPATHLGSNGRWTRRGAQGRI